MDLRKRLVDFCMVDAQTRQWDCMAVHIPSGGTKSLERMINLRDKEFNMGLLNSGKILRFILWYS